MSVFILGRYNFNKPDALAELRTQYALHGIDVEFLTAHSAKGREADYVIVAALQDGTYGFPSNVSDDPLLAMVLSNQETYPHAEERRLFYVAITRARRRVFLVAPSDRTSTFVTDDILGSDLSRFVEVVGGAPDRYPCPACKGQTIQAKQGRYGAFWGCTNYPLCEGKLASCPECREGALVPSSGAARRLRCNRCAYETEVCPRCGRGHLRLKQGPYSEFWGCSRWNRGEGCNFTRRNANVTHS